MSHYLGLLSLLVCIHACSGQFEGPIPIPPTPPGHVLGGGQDGALVHVEAFMEVNCPHSAHVWPQLQRIAQEYSGSDVRVTIHQFPLPYHRNGFLLTQGFYLVEALAPSCLEQFVDLCFEHLTYFRTHDQTEHDVIRSLAGLQEEVTGINKNTFAAGINNDTYKYKAIINWKYAVRRGAAGTTWFFINGVDMSFRSSDLMEYNTWKLTLDDLLGRTAASSSSSSSGSFSSSQTGSQDVQKDEGVKVVCNDAAGTKPKMTPIQFCILLMLVLILQLTP